jgi:hypothetical protein
MSNIFKTTSSSGGSLPTNVPTSFVTDINPSAIPAGNVLNVPGGSVTTNNPKGIQTDGSSGGATLTIELTNRITGTATTTDGATPQTLYTFLLGSTPGTYLFTVQGVAYNVTDDLAAGWNFEVCVRTSAAHNGLLVSSGNYFESEEGAMSGLVINFSASSAGNSISLVGTGLAGKTIDWRSVTTYIFVS